MITPDRWNQTIRGLLLIRLGQELGTDSQLARAVCALLDAIFGVLA